MEKNAQAEEALIAKATGAAALRHAIRAAELYMQAAGSASTKSEATRLRHKCQSLIALAEKLKAQNNATLSSGYPDILTKSSKLHGNVFPAWTSSPLDQEFQIPPGGNLFTDDAPFVLSPSQSENFASWSRPQELFAEETEIDDESVMIATRDCNFVQDITTDCSVVASLCAALEVLVGKHAVLSSIFHPFDRIHGRPRVSRSGKYVMKMNFNGCSRRVVIDDRLPASKTDRTLFVVDRRNPTLVWPALLEKAYLKVRGGYDFPGSNSGTDLWVLTGWIPEQIFLQREDFDLNETWIRIKRAYDAQDVVITLGTGRVSAEEEEVMGLVGEHDYAVLELDTTGDTRRLLIKNPWCNGPIWTGAGWATPQQSPASSLSLADGGHESPASAGTLWVALEDVAQHFESMYLNWNPSLFPNRTDLHFRWEKPASHAASSLIENKQFSVTPAQAGPVWILISRHFVDAELDIMRKQAGSMAAVSRQLGYMSILVFKNKGKRVQISGDEIYCGPYVDSPQTLARLDADANISYTVVLDQQELPLPSYSFTLSVFSHNSISLTEANEEMSHFAEQGGSWTRRTAGGNSSCPTYFINPQYKLTIDKASPISILIASDTRDIHVHVDLVWAFGRRAVSVRAKDVATSSGEYRKGCAVASISILQPGSYTLICSTFEPGQIANFAVRASSTTPVSLEPVPADAAGRLRKTLNLLKLAEHEERYRVPISAAWLTRSYVCARHVLPKNAEYGSRSAPSLMIRLSIVHGWGSQQVLLAESGEGEFQETSTVIRTPEFDIEPSRVEREGMWLILETIGMRHSITAIESDVFSDSSVEAGEWEIW